MKTKTLPPIHPGKMLIKEFLEPMGISQYRLAKDIIVSPRCINESVHGKRCITADALNKEVNTLQADTINIH